MKTLEVRRKELSSTRLVEEEDPRADEGQAVLEIERFGLTANNVTYGLIGDLVGYWRYFPTADADDAWGRVPAWGLATVTESRSEAADVGDRFYGYLPMGTHTVIEPKIAGSRRIADGAAHRAELPPIYSTYDAAPTERENETVILRPLFFTALVLDTAIAAHGAEQIVVSSASARTASAFAYFAAQRDVTVVGLTSSARVDWVRSLEIYDQVLSYDDLESLQQRSSSYVDISGSADLRDRIHERLSDELLHSASVGGTHQDPSAFTAPDDLPGPKPELFFAPNHKPDRDPLAAWNEYCSWTERWLDFNELVGIDQAADAWGRVLSGELGPESATVILPASA